MGENPVDLAAVWTMAANCFIFFRAGVGRQVQGLEKGDPLPMSWAVLGLGQGSIGMHI